MSDQQGTTVPVPCVECQREMDSPMVCASCGALNPLPGDTFNHFELFGLPCGYDIDEQVLHAKYLSLSRAVHPDIAGRRSPDIRTRSLSLSAELNRAYDTLRDDTARAEYLLSLAGGPSPADDKSVPADLLGEIMMLREGIEEALAAGDMASLHQTRQLIFSRRQAILDNIGRLCRSLGPDNKDVQKELRVQLNTIKYWNNLLDQIPTIAYRSDDDNEEVGTQNGTQRQA